MTEALLLFRTAAAEALDPPPRITVDEWADRHRILSGKHSAEPGPYRSARTPYLREPMALLSESSPVEQVVLMFGAQVGKSESGNNWLGYVIDLCPAPVMVVQPTTNTAKRYSRQRIAPMIDETPRLRERVAANRSRDDANTMLAKDFPGGALIIAGANSAAELRSMPVRFLFLDEIDAYPLDVDGEGDPISLAEKRTDTFARRKILKTSTPTTRGFSRIETAFDSGDRCRYWVPCPHCGAEQVLVWANVKWQRDDVGAPIAGTTAYACAHCAALIAEHHKPAMLAAGKWIGERPRRDIASFHLPALYSPLGWYSWEQAVHEFYEANEASKAGDVSKLKAWTNTVLAETWEEQGDKVSEHELSKRLAPFDRRTVIAACSVLTCGVDVQGDRLEAYVWAWGRGEQAQLVELDILYGSPADDAVWQRLDELLATRYLHASGATLPIAATAIDSGGHHTGEVYHYARTRGWRRVLACKGQSQPNKPVLGRPTDLDVNFRGVKIKRGVKLWPIGADTAKSTFYGRLRVAQPGPGYVHLGTWVERDILEQLTAERLVTRYHKGRPRLEWLKPAGRRNEALDCAVYAMAAAHWLGIPRWSELDWQRAEATLRQPDLLQTAADSAAPASAATPPATPEPPMPPAANRRIRGNFVNAWRSGQ